MPTHVVNIHSDGHATPNSQHALNSDTVSFTSNQGAWSVTFTGDSPFQGGVTCLSGAQGETKGGTVSGSPGTYKYTSCCTPPGGTPQSVDPEIVIDL